ncbi:hypothetical protein DVH05_021470 [Phytophthora capsici]|nr:hypothetical protein DVH05_021470 [Phytophthora capsici]
MAAPASTVQVYVCDYNGIARLVEVPVGTRLIELVDAAFESPTFTTGAFLGFEDGNLLQDQLVTAADAGRWTADEPLKLKYKVRTFCVIEDLQERRFVSGLVNDVETELEEKDDVKIRATVGKTIQEEEVGISKGAIEYQYQKILAESKRLKLPKREALSRRLIREILEVEPTSEEEMASMRGIRPAKIFNLSRFG